MTDKRCIVGPVVGLVVGFGLGLSTGHAKTLFIDFNNAENEIRIFKEYAASKRHEVVVLPSYGSINPSQRAAARKANSLLEMLTTSVQACALRKPRVDRCDEIYAAIRRAELLRIEATGGYTADDLKAELRNAAKVDAGEKFDTLVVSGHHETGYYSGELTQAKEGDLAQMLIDSGIERTQFSSVILLGCRTGTRNAYIEFLAPLFPDVALIFGAEENAPTRDEPRNLSFIRKLLLVRPALLLAKTRQDVEPIFRTLLVEHWPVSLLWRRHTLFFARSVEPFAVDINQHKR
jgi:hypothetical protein